jgi:hypothetical protein
MKSILKCGALLAALIVASALPAHADSGDTLDFNLSGPITASWTMDSNPTPFWSESGYAFAVNTTDLVVNGTPVTDFLCFFNINDEGGLNSSVALDDLYGPQVYSGDESDPTFITGTYYFTSWPAGNQEVLTITQAPEPASLLLLASGLVALGLKRKRQGETAN